MKRRDFLKQTAATVGAAGVLNGKGPYILGANSTASPVSIEKGWATLRRGVDVAA
jgi:hypothetical protein